MIVAGLTGSIAMGKSETARMFAKQGIPVFDSDAAVHHLYAKGGEAVAVIGALAPGAVTAEGVDRRRLATLVQADAELLKRVEAAVHPMVRKRQEQFLSEAEAAGADVALLDIPLLFETGRDKEVDLVIVVSAGATMQHDRAMSRPGMTEEKLAFILSRQVPDAEKRARADYVIDTSVSLERTAQDVERVLRDIRSKGKH